MKPHSFSWERLQPILGRNSLYPWKKIRQPKALKSHLFQGYRLCDTQLEVTRFFTIVTTSFGHPNNDIRICTAKSGCACAKSSAKCALKWASISSAASSRAIMSICSSKSHRILPSATLCAESKAVRHPKYIRNSSISANAIGGSASGPEDISQQPAATLPMT